MAQQAREHHRTRSPARITAICAAATGMRQRTSATFAMVHLWWTSGRSGIQTTPFPTQPAPTEPGPAAFSRSTLIRCPRCGCAPLPARCGAGSRPRLLHGAREEHQHDVQLSTRMPRRKVTSTRSERLCSKFRPRLHQVVDLAIAASTPSSIAGRQRLQISADLVTRGAGICRCPM